MSQTEDTEVLLALLSSLLDHPVDDQTVLLDALVQSDGDVQHAAIALNEKSNSDSSAANSVGHKRKRTAGLEGWLGLAPPETTRTTSDTSPSPKKKLQSRRTPSPPPSRRNRTEFEQGSSVLKSPRSPVKPKKPVTQSEFMSMLRPPNSKDASTKPSPLKFPPLTLATPELVAKHTPCTMHLSILPPELACR